MCSTNLRFIRQSRFPRHRLACKLCSTHSYQCGSITSGITTAIKRPGSSRLILSRNPSIGSSTRRYGESSISSRGAALPVFSAAHSTLSCRSFRSRHVVVRSLDVQRSDAIRHASRRDIGPVTIRATSNPVRRMDWPAVPPASKFFSAPLQRLRKYSTAIVE